MSDFDEPALPSEDEDDAFANELVYMADDGRMVGEAEALELAEYLVETNKSSLPTFRIPRDDDPPPQIQLERP